MSPNETPATTTISSHLRSIVFDCHHPASLARFWATVLDYTVRPYTPAEIDRLQASGSTPETDPTVVIDRPRPWPAIWFNRVSETQSTKNRVHPDIKLEIAEDVDRLIQLGARILRSAGDTPGED